MKAKPKQVALPKPGQKPAVKKGKKRGPKPKPKDRWEPWILESRGVRFPSLWWNAFDAIGVAEDRSKQGVIRDLIKEGLEKNYPNLMKDLEKRYASRTKQ